MKEKSKAVYIPNIYTEKTYGWGGFADTVLLSVSFTCKGWEENALTKRMYRFFPGNHCLLIEVLRKSDLIKFGKCADGRKTGFKNTKTPF